MQFNWDLWPCISQKIAREGPTSLLIHRVVGRIQFPRRYWFLAIWVSLQSTSQHGGLPHERVLTGKYVSLPKSQKVHILIESKLTRSSLFQELQNFLD